jgi:hypothetical protein
MKSYFVAPIEGRYFFFTEGLIYLDVGDIVCVDEETYKVLSINRNMAQYKEIKL